MRKFLTIFCGILLIFCGATLMFRPISAFATLGYVIAVGLFVNGIANIVTWIKIRKEMKISLWYLIFAIISVIFAIAIFTDVFFKIAMELALVYIVAAYFFISGIIRIVLAFKLRKLLKEEKSDMGKNWLLVLIIGIIFIICGILSFANPLILAITLGMMLGINMFVCGIDLITLSSIVGD